MKLLALALLCFAHLAGPGLADALGITPETEVVELKKALVALKKELNRVFPTGVGMNRPQIVKGE